MARIQVVEDEGIIARDIQSTLESLGHQVPALAASGVEAIRLADKHRPDLVLMDIVLKGAMDGVEAAAEIRQRFDIPVVFLTAYGNDETLDRAKVTEPFGYILKPFEERELHITVEIALYRHQMERRLKDINAQLRSALRSKEEMIHSVSHELRTPLTHIQGYLSLLADRQLGVLSSEQDEAVQIMTRQAGRLGYMVDRLLALQTLDPAQLQTIRLEMGPWVRAAVEAWATLPGAAGVPLRIDVPLELPAVLGDPDALNQVIVNLLDNAVKFSSTGREVAIVAGCTDDEVLVAIADQGIGIAAEHLDAIFERFYQVDRGLAREYGGMGIGLSLCRKIVAAHDGRIWAESGGPGKGSTFYVALPVIDPGHEVS